jgi:hypothetical protein
MAFWIESAAGDESKGSCHGVGKGLWIVMSRVMIHILRQFRQLGHHVEVRNNVIRVMK